MSETQPPEIDVAKVAQELKIRPEIYTKLVVSFTKSLVGKMNALSDAMSVNDTDQMRMILHEIKGTAGNLRLKSISGPEDLMHVAVKAGENQKTIMRHFELLRQAVESLQQAIVKLEP